MRKRVISSHTSGKRPTWWYLIQENDGGLYVRHESESPNERTKRVISINDFMKEGGRAKVELQKLIDRMFEDALPS